MNVQDITTGIYDSHFGYSIKVTKVEKQHVLPIYNRKTGKVRKKKTLLVEMHFTNNPNYGKSTFAMEGKTLASFFKGYKKRT